jgi:hypothetical protein
MIKQSTAARACCSTQCLPGGSQGTETPPCRSSNQVIVRPPRLRHPHRAASPATSPSPRPASASSPAGRSSGAPGPLRSVTSTRTTPARAVTVTVTACPGQPERLCCTLLPKSSLTSKTASSPHGCPGPSTAPTNARTTPARSVRPATRTLSRTVALIISAPAFPAVRKNPRAATGRPGNARSPQPPASSRISTPGGLPTPRRDQSPPPSRMLTARTSVSPAEKRNARAGKPPRGAFRTAGKYFTMSFYFIGADIICCNAEYPVM